MIISGPAIYFDGKTAARHPVTVELEPSGLVVRAANGSVLARWPYHHMEQSTAHEGVFRILCKDDDDLEQRIEVRDAMLAHAIDELSHPVDRTGLVGRRSRRKIVLWSIAAVASLLMVGIFGIPELATRLAPYVPYSIELKIGEAVNQQIRTALDPGNRGDAFECGLVEKEKEGKAAVERMVGRLEQVARLPIPLRLKVVRRKEANAIALPGGFVYVFEGLIAQAKTADEVAGVVAHEIGHVAHRDGMRSLLQSGGLAFMFGLVLGDFVGGGAVVIASKTILRLAYSRHVEAQADIYAVDLVERAGGNPRALGEILMRIAGGAEPDIRILTNHPATKERAQSINAATRDINKGSLLTPEEWLAMKRVCSGS
jgi:Zn-dependent protease with chaperone function